MWFRKMATPTCFIYLTKTNKSMKVALKYTYSLFQYSVLLLTYTGTLLVVYSMLDMVYGILFN
jgi:hypothetical protein